MSLFLLQFKYFSGWCALMAFMLFNTRPSAHTFTIHCSLVLIIEITFFSLIILVRQQKRGNLFNRKTSVAYVRVFIESRAWTPEWRHSEAPECSYQITEALPFTNTWWGSCQAGKDESRQEKISHQVYPLILGMNMLSIHLDPCGPVHYPSLDTSPPGYKTLIYISLKKKIKQLNGWRPRLHLQDTVRFGPFNLILMSQGSQPGWASIQGQRFVCLQ